MLDVVFSDGRIESFDYNLPKRLTFLPEGKLILWFGKDCIVVEGSNLGRMREQIIECRRRFILQRTEAGLDIKLAPVLGQLDYALVRWAKRKYKRLGSLRRATAWLKRIVQQKPQLFAHWRITYAAMA